MYTVLVVDDNRVNGASVVEAIECAYGKTVAILEASNVQEALRISEAALPNLIISDLEMPGKDGLEFYREIARLILLAQSPALTLSPVLILPPVFVLMSGKAKIESTIEAEYPELLARFIAKPFSMDAFLAFLAGIIPAEYAK